MQDNSTSSPATFDEWFESVFSRVLSGEQIEFYWKDPDLFRKLSRTFEVLTTQLMADVPSRKYHWYDGLTSLNARSRKARQIEFEGHMVVSDVGNVSAQWTEPFRLRVTDKRVTTQGLWITLWLGEDRAEAQWSEIFPD